MHNSNNMFIQLFFRCNKITRAINNPSRLETVLNTPETFNIKHLNTLLSLCTANIFIRLNGKFMKSDYKIKTMTLLQ